jgi:hypothetical protein
LADDFPQIKQNVAKHLQSLKEWVEGFSGVKSEKQTAFLRDKSDDLLSMGGKAASGGCRNLK